MAGRPGLTEGAVTEKLTLTSGDVVSVVKVPRLSLYVITDCDNLGPNWVKVIVNKNVYTTQYLLGGDEETYCPIARFFAQHVVGKWSPFCSPSS